MFANLLERPLGTDATAELSAFRFSSPEAFAVFNALLSAVKDCQTEGNIEDSDPLAIAKVAGWSGPWKNVSVRT